jgi:hypothetical protein
MEGSAAVPLTSAPLIDKAVLATGLEDFGRGAWRDGLEVFCDSLNADADLNELGVAVHESRIGNALAQRLRVVDWHRSHPDAATRDVRPPAIIVGLPRTGTTALAHLMAADPDSRSLRTWEAGNPVPPPGSSKVEDDARIAATQAGIDMSHQLMPDLPRLYFATATSPTETLDLTGMSFRCFQFDGQANVPTYIDWLLTCDMRDAYDFQRSVHQLLQHQDDAPQRWTWKNPSDVFWLREVREAFPQATFIWTHREPVAALSSVCSLVAVVRALCTDDVERTELGPRQAELWASGIDRGLAARDALGEEAFADVFMDDLARDPIGTMQQLYDRLGWPFTAAAERGMRAWLDENPRHGRGGHDPDPRELGLDVAMVRERFATYQQRFGMGEG